MYPSFMAAANDLEALLINRQASDPDILRRFVGRSAPQVVNTNQMIALLNAGLYSQADSVADFVADNEQSHLLLAVNAVLNGRIVGQRFAICLNRLDDPVDAYKALKKALEMDPSLEKIAHVDGDVNDLLLDKKNQPNEQ